MKGYIKISKIENFIDETFKSCLEREKRGRILLEAANEVRGYTGNLWNLLEREEMLEELKE